MNLVEMPDRKEWRSWLASHHASEKEAWLVYHKAGSGIRGIAYEDSVEEALCFGWVDSIIQKLDDSRYARKFTPRKENSKWSTVNRRRAERMIAAGLMTEIGMQKVEAARHSGAWDNPADKPVFNLDILPEFAAALKENPAAQEFFESLPRSHQKEYLLWINTAKRPDTRDRRIAESIQLLTGNKKLGLR